MKRHLLSNAGVSDSPRFTKTPEGYLAGEMGLMRPGVLDYEARELGLPGDGTVGVYFPEEVVFHENTLSSAAMKPVAIEHPGDITAANYSELSVGHIGSGLENKDGILTAKYVITDSDAIAQVEAGKDKTSIRFGAPLVLEQGEWEGKPYSLRAEEWLDINHIGCVDAGRAGPAVRINNQGGDHPVTTTRQSDSGTININLNNTGQPAPETPPETPAGQDDQAARQADFDAQVQAKAKARAYVLTNAAPLLEGNVRVDEMSNLDILKAALKDYLQEGEDYTEDYLTGMIRVVVENRGKATDAQRRMLQNAGPGDGGNPNDKPEPTAREKFIQWQQDAYKQNQREFQAGPQRLAR